MVSKLQFKPSTMVLSLLMLFTLSSMGSALVQAAPSAVQATEVPCPAPDTHGSSLITEYAIPTANSAPRGIAAGPDGALWFGPTNGKSIGRITTDGAFTEYPFPLAHEGDQRFLVAGPDGAMWFNDDWQNQIGRIAGDGSITEYPIPSGVEDTDDNGATYITSLPRGLVTGADGALWFTEAYGNNIGRITVNGDVTEYPLPTAASFPIGIALGSDDAVWFVERDTNQIGRITTEGEITEYPVPTPDSFLLRIAAGSDGALWFTEFAGNQIGRITLEGVITEYALPPCANPTGLTAGPDQAIWFTEYNGNKIGRISMDGQITEYVIPTPESVPFNIVTGSDGALWFTEYAGGKIGRLQVQSAPVTAAVLTTFSSTKYKLHMSLSFGPDWHVLDDYPDLLTLEKKQEGWQLGFNIVNNAKLADPVDGHLVPFPDDFVSWIKSDPTLVTGEAHEVMVGGIKGIQIDFTSTRTTTKNFLYLTSGTVWNIDHAAFGRFILLNDVNGERVFIWLVLTVDADEFTLANGLVQPILDSVVFTQ